MRKRLRPYLERFWVWLGGEPPAAETEVAADPDPGQFEYTVQPGDALSSIARRFGTSVWILADLNDLEDPSLVRVGQRLLVPRRGAPPPAPLLSAKVEPGPELTLCEPEPIPWPDEAIRGIYVSYFAIGHEARRRHVSELLINTEINALVIDVKGDNGLISYPTSITLAHDIGAARPTARDFDELMDFFKANNVYTIARIVAFKDHLFARAHPEWAVQREGVGLWHDGGERAWADPFAQAAWVYNADLAAEAAQRGFDEIQFDCVRFPVPSREGPPHFSQASSREARVEAITSFLSYVRERLASLEVRVAANVFGYACWRKDATFIGQDIERLVRHLDVLCPKLYPSTFGYGIPGYEYAIAHPYEIVYESMKRLVDRVNSPDSRVRPWIQDFPDFRFDKRAYGPDQVRAQMRGSFDAGGDGYMAWDPKIRYTAAAYFQKTIDMSL